MARRTIMVVDDEEQIRLPIRHFLDKKGYDVLEAETVAAALKLFRAERPDAAVVDYALPDGDGLSLLHSLKEVDPSVPLVMLTAHGSINLAVKAVKEGAEQFLTKPVELQALLVIIQRVLENQRNRQVSVAGRTREARQAPDPFLGESSAIARLAQRARRVVDASVPILIHGETGTGKGVLADWLHRNGRRSQEAFVDLNCAGLSRELLESELFGHEKGAFTGAVNAKPGLLEIAHRGSVFLDEIGDVDPQVQPKLLTVIEQLRFRRLGAVRDRQVDVRLIAATHRDLAQMVRDGKFREDLYYRIRALPLTIPPLRERGSDVVLMARMLLERIATEVGRPGATLSGAAEKAIAGHAWPGNVRELRNVLEHAALLADKDVLEPHDLKESLVNAAPPQETSRLTLAEAERRHIDTVLREEKWVVPRAAKVLGLSRSALYERIKKHQIALPRGEP